MSYEEKMDLDKIIEKIKETFKTNGFIKNIGIEYIECGDGKAKGRLKLSENVKNPYGMAHGGCLFSLADTIAGIAAMTRGSYVTTLSSSIEYLRPGKNTDYIYADAREIKNGRTVSVYDVFVTDDSGKNLAKATLSYYKISPIS